MRSYILLRCLVISKLGKTCAGTKAEGMKGRKGGGERVKGRRGTFQHLCTVVPVVFAIIEQGPVFMNELMYLRR